MRKLVNAIVSTAVLGACVYGYILLGERDQPERRRPPRAKGVSVETELVKAHLGPVTLEANGVVVPFREIRLAAEVRGRVIEHSENLRPGRVVQAGETLVKLDATEYRLAVRRLKQQQTQVEAELSALDVQVENNRQLIALAEKDLQLRQQELRRVSSLVEKAVSSQAAVEAAQRTELVSRSALVELQNRARELETQRVLLAERKNLLLVDLARAEFDEQRTVVSSTVAGVVVQSMVEEHSFLLPGDPIAVIEDSEAMEVNCSLTLDDMYWIWNDDTIQTGGNGDTAVSLSGFTLPSIPVTVRFDLGDRAYAWSGVLSRQGEVGLDERTRTVPCRVLVGEPERVRLLNAPSNGDARVDGPRRLMRGMFVAVEIECHPRRPLLHVPERAIRPGTRIWIAKGGRLKIVHVEVVSRDNDAVVIDAHGEVQAGDQLIVSPVANVRDGLPVRIPDAPPQPPIERNAKATVKGLIR